MHEELLINNISRKTLNENIIEAEEKHEDSKLIMSKISIIEKFLSEKDDAKLLKILEDNVEGFSEIQINRANCMKKVICLMQQGN